MMLDRLISKAYVSAVKGRLLLEDTLTLDEALTIAGQVEMAIKNATLLSSMGSATTTTVQTVGTVRKYF